MTTTPTVFGSRIRQARLRAGKTQAQLARAIGTSERNIVRWETDRNAPRMEHLAAIAQATGTTVDAFLQPAASEDDEDPQRQMSLDDYLRLRVRELMREELVQ